MPRKIRNAWIRARYKYATRGHAVTFALGMLAGVLLACEASQLFMRLTAG